MFKPSDATPESKLPVLIYIQGGGYAAMGNPNYNGTEIIQSSGGNMVVVMFNYRVGVLGFLASNKLGHDADLNVGLLDQRQLFLWVQKHISKVCSWGSTKILSYRQLTIIALSVRWRSKPCCHTRLINWRWLRIPSPHGLQRPQQGALFRWSDS